MVNWTYINSLFKDNLLESDIKLHTSVMYLSPWIEVSAQYSLSWNITYLIDIYIKL